MHKYPDVLDLFVFAALHIFVAVSSRSPLLNSTLGTLKSKHIENINNADSERVDLEIYTHSTTAGLILGKRIEGITHGWWECSTGSTLRWRLSIDYCAVLNR